MFSLPYWWLRKATEKDFDYVAEDDFNPDGVVLFGYDSYEKGVRHGIYIATACAGLTIAAAIATKRYINKRNAEEKKGENKCAK